MNKKTPCILSSLSARARRVAEFALGNHQRGQGGKYPVRVRDALLPENHTGSVDIWLSPGIFGSVGDRTERRRQGPNESDATRDQERAPIS